MEQVWEIMSEQLYFISFGFGVEVHAFVLMNNHFHLLLSTPEANLSEAMSWFMRETSRALTRAGNRMNQTYGGRHFRCVVGSHHYYLNAYKYLYANPLKAGMCSNVTDYPYSSLRGLLGLDQLAFPVVEDLTLFSDLEGTLDWLNQVPSEENWEVVRRALRRKEFGLPQIDSRPHPLEVDTL